MQYKIQKNSFGDICAVTIIGQNISIPFDPQNTDYQAYLIWLEEGNTPEPADIIPEPVPLTPQEKLASAGLTVDELKVLLGIA